MRNLSQTDFVKFWLSDGELGDASEIEAALEGSSLKLNKHLFGVCADLPEAAELLGKAKQEGFPPLPEEARLLKLLAIEAQPEWNFGCVKPERSLWENIQGARFSFLHLTGLAPEFMEGAETLNARDLHLDDLEDTKFWDFTPRLKSANPQNTTTLSLMRCQGVTELGEDMLKYLRTAETDRVSVNIWNSRTTKTLHPRFLESLLPCFEQTRLSFYGVSLPPNFLDSNPSAMKLIWEHKMAVYCGITSWNTDNLPSVIEPKLALLVNDAPPLRNPWAFEKRGYHVYSQAGKTSLSNLAEKLRW